ncbi:MAG: hypothetical protein JNM31_03415 [Flavobacteriales bacterium]|nr:hypothetical protein [Flavobacteriales bacterium]
MGFDDSQQAQRGIRVLIGGAMSPKAMVTTLAGNATAFQPLVTVNWDLSVNYRQRIGDLTSLRVGLQIMGVPHAFAVTYGDLLSSGGQVLLPAGSFNSYSGEFDRFSVLGGYMREMVSTGGWHVDASFVFALTPRRGYDRISNTLSEVIGDTSIILLRTSGAQKEALEFSVGLEGSFYRVTNRLNQVGVNLAFWFAPWSVYERQYITTPGQASESRGTVSQVASYLSLKVFYEWTWGFPKVPRHMEPK